MESVLPICRLCLNVSNDYIEFQTLYECDEINYLQCLRLCTNLPIEENDGGPQSLCSRCATELDIVYKFLQKAQHSHAILEQSREKNNYSKEITELAEISIEKFEVAEIEVSDSEFTLNAEYFSDCAEFSNDSAEFSNYFNEVPKDCNVSSKDFFEDEILDDTNINLEEVDTNACKVNEFPQKPEESKTSQKNTHTFIPKKHKCHICNRFYSTERLLKNHLNYHKRRNVGSKPYSCKICGESFSLQRYLTQHMIEHKDCRETHKCQYCEKEYVTKTALNSHKRIHQGEALNCNECGKQFYGSYEFSVHQRFHRREKRGSNKCEICCKEFSSSRYLTQHMVVHVDDREIYKCIYCSKEYISKTALDNHKRLHEGHTTQCDICEKHFTRNCELKIHMRFHKREHPFKCTMCGKAFTIKGHLKTHMWQHQGIKLECGECGKLFGSTKSLNEHSFTHGEMPYPCEFCDKAYPSRQKYKLHLEKVHCSDVNKMDLKQIENLTNTKIPKMQKNFTYVQITREEEEK